MSEEDYKKMRSIVDLGCINITKDNIVHMSRKTHEQKEQQLELYKEVIEEVRERSKLERKTALSLNQHYAVSIIDSVLQILDKVKGE